MIAKVIPMTNYTSTALFPFPASVLSILSIIMDLIGQTRQFAHAQGHETFPLSTERARNYFVHSMKKCIMALTENRLTVKVNLFQL